MTSLPTEAKHTCEVAGCTEWRPSFGSFCQAHHKQWVSGTDHSRDAFIQFLRGELDPVKLCGVDGCLSQPVPDSRFCATHGEQWAKLDRHNIEAWLRGELDAGPGPTLEALAARVDRAGRAAVEAAEAVFGPRPPCRNSGPSVPGSVDEQSASTPDQRNGRQVAQLTETVNGAEPKGRSMEGQPAPTTSPDPVNHPAHYIAGKVECIDALEAATEGLTGAECGLTWSALKYLWRWKRKGGAEDLHKARWYLERLLAHVEAGR